MIAIPDSPAAPAGARPAMSTIRVAHTVMSISRHAGGLQGAVRDLAQTLAAAQCAETFVLALRDDQTDADLDSWSPLAPKSYTPVGPRAFGYAPAMRADLRTARLDLVHCHGLWLYPSLATLGWAKETRRPYVVSPHGMLESRFELKKSRVKKRLATWLYQGRHLRRAACIHALCRAEGEDIRRFGLKNPIVVIPNGVTVPAAWHGPDAPPWGDAVEPGRNVLLYLGRINPKKGLHHLLRALESLRQTSGVDLESWCVVVVGWDQAGHAEALKSRATSLGLTHVIKFVGPLFGEKKNAAFRAASGFILPSESEGLPLVVLEAWAHKLPVIMTPHCNIPEGARAGAAIEVDASPAGVAEGILRPAPNARCRPPDDGVERARPGPQALHLGKRGEADASGL